MRKFTLLLLTLAIAVSLTTVSLSMVVVTDLTTLTPASLVNTLLGPGVAFSAETYVGDPSAGGDFVGGTGIVGFESGVILGSGAVSDVVGPNTASGTTTLFGLPGDPDLDGLIPGFSTFDASVLEFDFACPVGVDVASFKYVFASEEYPEFVNTPLNDTFGFFLNGTNIALLPDNITPVAINNVNGGNPVECGDSVDNDADTLIDGADSDCTAPLDNIVGEANANTAFFINNDIFALDGAAAPPVDIEADGLTVVLGAQGAINPGTNHIKLAIADAGDSVLDSWVFIEAGSFNCAPLDDGSKKKKKGKKKKNKKAKKSKSSGSKSNSDSSKSKSGSKSK